MTKFLQKSKYVIAVFLVILLASPFVLAGCGGTQITALSISLENSVSTVKANETYRVEVLSNTGESVPDATLEVLKGNNYVTVKGQSITINDNAPSNAEILLVASYQNIMSNQLKLNVEERQVTSLSLALENGVTDIEPEQEYTLVVSGDAPDEINNATISIISGGENITLDGKTIRVNADATPGARVILQATYENIESKHLVLTVAHIEAESVTLVVPETQVYSGEIVSLGATVEPSNATREVEYVVLSNNATVSGNNLVINSGLNVNTTVSVQARVGEIVSPVVTLTVIALEDNDVFDVIVENNNLQNGTLSIDTSITSSAQTLGAMLYVWKGKKLVKIYSQDIKYTVDNPAILNINSDATILPLQNGTTNVTATYKDSSETVKVRIMMTPSVVYLPSAYEDSAVDYNFASNTVLSDFAPNIPTPNGCTDYKLTVFNGGVSVARFATAAGQTTAELENENISYDGSTLKVADLGTYSFVFESFSGCTIEKQSQNLTICFNNGTNVSTLAELQNAANDQSIKIVNFTADITMSGGTENFKIFGGKEINGNGHTVDVHEQLIGLNKYNDTESALFLFRPVDKYTPFSVVFRDLNLVGNFGYWSTERVLEVIQRDDPSFTAEQVENDLGRGFYNRFSYKAAIIIYNDYYEPDGKTQYSYAIPYIKNVNISGFNVGMKLYYSVDEIALTGSGRPAVRDVTLSNMFGDGMTFEASTVTVENVNAGIMGGPPIALNGPDKADNAGAYRNQVAYTNLVGSINIDNPTDGTGLFLKYELSVNDGIAALFTQIKGGVATVINTVVGFLVSKVQAPYREAGDFEMVEKIASSITNILQTQNVNGVNRDMFNLVYYNASEAGVLNIEDKSQIVQMDEQFCLNGIDTTHKFIEVHFYDVLAQLPAFSSLISQYEDVLRPLMVIIANYNYVENN